MKTTATPSGGEAERPGFAGVVSIVAAGKRLAKALQSKHDPPSKSFCFNDNGSMVDLRCKDNARTFQGRAATVSPTDPEVVVLHGPEVAVVPVFTVRSAVRRAESGNGNLPEVNRSSQKVKK